MPNHRDLFKDFCKKVVASQAYQNKLQLRMQEGKLHPSMEALVVQFAIGKPSGTADGDDARDLTELTDAELVKRSEALLKRFREQIAELPMAGRDS